MHDTLDAWEHVSVDFRSVREGFVTSTALGRLLLNTMDGMGKPILPLVIGAAGTRAWHLPDAAAALGVPHPACVRSVGSQPVHATSELGAALLADKPRA